MHTEAYIVGPKPLNLPLTVRPAGLTSPHNRVGRFPPPHSRYTGTGAFWHDLGRTARWEEDLWQLAGTRPPWQQQFVCLPRCRLPVCRQRWLVYRHSEFWRNNFSYVAYLSAGNWTGCLFCPRRLWLSASVQQRCKASYTTASSFWYASDITRSEEVTVTEVFRHSIATCLC